MRLRVAWLFLFLFLFLSSRSWADAASEEAKRLYAKGNQHFALAEYEQAVAAFKEAFRHKEDPALLFNIAQSYRQIRGQEQNAIRLYRSFLQRSPHAPNREEVERKIDELEKALSGQPPGETSPPTTPTVVAQTAPPRWVAVKGAVPSGVVEAGSERGKPLYVCHAEHQGGVHPGKVVGKACNIAWKGAEVAASKFEVLVAAPEAVRWVAAMDGAVPEGALVGGQDGTSLFPVCRVRQGNADHPGKLDGQSCSIGYGGREVKAPRYEILVEKVSVPTPAEAPPTPEPTPQPVPLPAPVPVPAASPRPKRVLEAGPLWNGGHAKQRCPQVCSSAGLVWQGGWWTTIPNKMSVCECQ